MIEVTVDALTTNELSTLSYNVSAFIVSSNASIQTLGMRKYTTLMDSYVPHNITNVTVVNWMPMVDEDDSDEEYPYLNLVIQWQPAIDRTCSYDVVYHGYFGDDNENRIDEREVNMNQLYQFKIPEKLHYGEEYNLGVRGKNTQHPYLQSNFEWTKFIAPSSQTRFLIKNLTIHELKHLGDQHFNVNVTWITTIKADNYRISIHDADENIHNKTTEPVTLDGSFSSHIFKDVALTGSTFRVELNAFKDNQNYTATIVEITPKYKKDKIDEIFFYSLIAFMFLLLIALFKVWKGRIDSFISILAQKRMESMDLETVKTMSTGTALDLIAELTKDTSMEIETENITMLESLGEGAFGLVNKALMIKGGEKEYVAVKMLKSKKIILN